MGRRKKGRAISGWLIIDKPAGVTSTAVVAKVRWALDAQKAGHAGTLDPEATGVLAVALGEATKTVPYVTDALKAYRFDMVLGTATDTDDAEGEVIATSDQRPDADTIRQALGAFTGDIEQVPPQFSAVKVDGQRAYARARGGEEMELAARPLYVESLDLVALEGDVATLDLVCGKGGYVRSIARDLGAALGCYGHVKRLRRIWSGPFEPSDGIDWETLEALARTPELDAHLHPVHVGLQDLDEVHATPEGAARLRNGNPGMVLGSGLDYGQEVWASHEGTPVAIGLYKAGELHPTRVFNL